MEFLKTILALIVTLGVLIAFHELGHFLVARAFRIKVVRFSIGFGKVIWRKLDKYGTEFAISAIPLGGYVAMLDDAIAKEENIEITAEDKTKLFSAKPLWSRFLVILAGPLFNFILAIILFWFLFARPYYALMPVIGRVEPNSIAAQQNLQALDKIISINAKSINSWQQAFLEFSNLAGETTSIKLEILRDSQLLSRFLPVNNFINNGEKNPLTFLGITPYTPKQPPIIGKILKGSPAELAGLQVNDAIVKVDKMPIDDWSKLVQIIEKNPNKNLIFSIKRAGENIELALTTKAHKNGVGVLVGYIGAGVKFEQNMAEDSEYLERIDNSIFQALWLSFARTWDISVITLTSVGKIALGVLAPDNLSGPISIAKMAYNSANVGWQNFLQFLAFVSISLGVLNILPIPMLDGGQLLFLIFEGIGIKLSEKAKIQANIIGFAVLTTIMIMAIYFDILRL